MTSRERLNSLAGGGKRSPLMLRSPEPLGPN